MILLILKLFIYTFLIVVICKYVLVKYIRKLAEVLNLSSKTIGNISGFATSIPELLTVSFSAFTGFINTGLYNILSSNIINLGLYSTSIIANKNIKIILKNMGLKIEILLSIITIIIPIVLMLLKINIEIQLVPILILLFILFYYIDINVHKLYLKKEDNIVYDEIEKEKKYIKGKNTKGIVYLLIIIAIMIILFFIGNKLSYVIEELCIKFNLPEILLGIILGFSTSIPELITFFEAQKFHEEADKQLGVIEATNNLLSSNLLCLFIIQSIGILIYYVFN